jgi:hypothetical protein
MKIILAQVKHARARSPVHEFRGAKSDTLELETHGRLCMHILIFKRQRLRLDAGGVGTHK